MPPPMAASIADASGATAADPEVLVVGCRAPEPSHEPTRACPGKEPTALQLTKLAAASFGVPVFLTHSPNDPDRRLFVVSLEGRIHVIEDGVLLTVPFLDISPQVLGSDGIGEQGLLGMAFDPDYEATGRFWVNYTARNLPFGIMTVIESYRVSTGPKSR